MPSALPSARYLRQGGGAGGSGGEPYAASRLQQRRLAERAVAAAERTGVTADTVTRKTTRCGQGGEPHTAGHH